MTLEEAKCNINKKVIYSTTEEEKEGIIVSVGLHVFVKFDDCDYNKAIPSSSLKLAE